MIALLYSLVLLAVDVSGDTRSPPAPDPRTPDPDCRLQSGAGVILLLNPHLVSGTYVSGIRKWYT